MLPVMLFHQLFQPLPLAMAELTLTGLIMAELTMTGLIMVELTMTGLIMVGLITVEVTVIILIVMEHHPIVGSFYILMIFTLLLVVAID